MAFCGVPIGGVHGSFSPTRMVRRPTDAETLAEANWRHEIRSSAKPAVPSDAVHIHQPRRAASKIDTNTQLASRCVSYDTVIRLSNLPTR
jgi:hypothetical protein